MSVVSRFALISVMFWTVWWGTKGFCEAGTKGEAGRKGLRKPHLRTRLEWDATRIVFAAFGIANGHARHTNHT
jgi:hypothetical protein